ncbi:hypothetical protein C8R43DRAFT_2825 [Mycena crocata]|nr:hypothetical protein C8R43DRAFT_2825 [Mycena crocata]
MPRRRIGHGAAVRAYRYTWYHLIDDIPWRARTPGDTDRSAGTPAAAQALQITPSEDVIRPERPEPEWYYISGPAKLAANSGSLGIILDPRKSGHGPRSPISPLSLLGTSLDNSRLERLATSLPSSTTTHSRTILVCTYTRTLHSSAPSIGIFPHLYLSAVSRTMTHSLSISSSFSSSTWHCISLALSLHFIVYIFRSCLGLTNCSIVPL